jgi:hypothetical protein
MESSVSEWTQSILLGDFYMTATIQSNHMVWALAFGLTTAMGVTACGGGGSGGGSTAAPVSISYSGVTTAATITSSNAAAISGGAVNGVTTSAASGGAVLGVTSPGSTVGTVDSNSMTQVVKKLATQAISPASGTPAPLGVASGSNVVAGSCGGSITVSASATNTTTVTGSIVYSKYCETGIVFVSGTSNFTADVTVSGQNATVNSIMITTAPSALLNVYVQHAGLVFWVNNLNLTVNAQSGYDDVTVSATYYHPTYGYVTLTTPTTLHTVAGDLYPSSGSLLSTDTANRRALVTTINASSYQLQIDADANGVYETTTTGTWSSL